MMNISALLLKKIPHVDDVALFTPLNMTFLEYIKLVGGTLFNTKHHMTTLY